MSRPPTPAYERAMSKATEIDGDCILFVGDLHSAGYGRLRSSTYPYRYLLAHRVVWEHHNGPVPDGLEVTHSCDKPACVNIEHLSARPHAENMLDIRRRDRWANQFGAGANWKGVTA